MPEPTDCMASPRGLSSSRAYWELITDQVMDRVFAGSAASLSSGAAPLDAAEWSPIDVVVRDEPPTSPGPPPAALADPPPRRRLNLLLGLLGAVSLLGIGCTLLVWQQWNRSNEALAQERNLQLLERLRSLGPGAAENGSVPASLPGLAAQGSNGAALDPNLPPPPAEEPWVQELGSLDGGGKGLPAAAAPLRVPLRGPLQRPVPPAVVPVPANPGSLPELVGVVEARGRGGSAIFSLDGTSTSTAVGEPIGSTGWRLQATDGESVLIERNGQQQRVSIGGSP